MVGEIYYSGTEKDRQIIRVFKEVENTHRCKTIKGLSNDYINIETDELTDWVKLTPDGYLCVSVADYDDLKDVITTLHVRGDSFDKNNPDIVCRQNAFDIFYMMCNPGMKAPPKFGVSVSKKTCPVEVTLGNFLVADKYESTAMIAVYNTDDLNTLLGYIRNVSKYDKILGATYQVTRGQEFIGTLGWCKTYRELLESTGFMKDFHEAFNIFELPFSVRDPELVPQEALVDCIVEKKRVVPSTVYVYPYDKTINLRDIKREYMLVTADSSQCAKDDTGVYILAYDINPSVIYEDYKYGGKDKMKERIKEMGFH